MVTVNLSRFKQTIAEHSIVKWTEAAICRAAFQGLNVIYKTPLNENFHNKAGISVRFCYFDYNSPIPFGWPKLEGFFRVYSLFKYLEEKGLVEIWIEGYYTFHVKTLKSKDSLKEIISSSKNIDLHDWWGIYRK